MKGQLQQHCCAQNNCSDWNRRLTMFALEFGELFSRKSDKLGCVVRMVVDSILFHVESGRNDHQKDAPHFIHTTKMHYAI